MIFYPRVCVHCREEFEPLEGNETRDFCSWECEEDHAREEDAEYENAQAYNEGFGRNPF